MLSLRAGEQETSRLWAVGLRAGTRRRPVADGVGGADPSPVLLLSCSIHRLNPHAAQYTLPRQSRVEADVRGRRSTVSEFGEFTAAAVAVAREAGAILRDGLGGPRQIAYKGQVDLVTEMEKRSEATINPALTRQ